MQYGPVSIGMAATGAFDYYSGGILSDCGHTSINHDVALVGWDDSQGPAGVWFLRNSWGTGWGEGGYMRIPYGCDMVGYQAARVDYRGLRPFKFSFASVAASEPEGNGTAYFAGTVTSISKVADVITLSTSESGGWPIDFQVQGDPAYYQSYALHLAPGQATGITVRVRTDDVKRLGAGILSGTSANTGRLLQARLNVFNVAPSILLVDDDNGAHWDTPFIQGLGQLGDLYVRVDASSGPVQLAGYDAVIWATGYLVSPLNQSEMNALMTYLDAGGTLFLSSMDLLTGLTLPNTFVTKYLGVQSWTINTRANSAIGVSGDPITSGMNMSLNWPTNGANRVDTVNPGSGASAIFYSETGHPAAVRYDSGTFRTVFNSIAQNAMPTDNPNPNNSNTVIQNTLDWLLRMQPTGVESAQSQRSAPDLWTRPNPTKGAAEIGFSLETSVPRISLSVVDAGGRVVRNLVGGPTTAGSHRINWDGRDDSGYPVPAGCYFARLDTSTGVRSSRIIVVN